MTPSNDDNDALLPKSICWSMANEITEHRFLIAGQWLVVGVYNVVSTSWMYSVHRFDRVAEANAFAVASVEFQESFGSTIQTGPVYDTARLNRHWMISKEDMKAQYSGHFDRIFGRALSVGQTLVAS